MRSPWAVPPAPPISRTARSARRGPASGSPRPFPPATPHVSPSIASRWNQSSSIRRASPLPAAPHCAAPLAAPRTPPAPELRPTRHRASGRFRRLRAPLPDSRRLPAVRTSGAPHSPGGQPTPASHGDLEDVLGSFPIGVTNGPLTPPRGRAPPQPAEPLSSPERGYTAGHL
jgi:hypothetical protein